MRARRLLAPGPAVALLLSLTLLLILALELGVPLPISDDRDEATVTIRDANGTELAVVDVRVASTSAEQYVGLSDTDSLGPDEGMLFVFDEEDERRFVMRDVEFPLDIVFVGADGRITTIHEAPVEDGIPLTRYTGRAKWVLEVERGYTEANGIAVGDEVAIAYADDR